MTPEQIAALEPAFAAYLQQFLFCCDYTQTFDLLEVYCRGLLSDLTRKSGELIALQAGVAVRPLQEFLKDHHWSFGQARGTLQGQVAITLPDQPDQGLGTIGLVDETATKKKGTKTPGVQRQYCGELGKKENCIVTVHLGVARGGYKTLGDQEWEAKAAQVWLSWGGEPTARTYWLIWARNVRTGEEKYFVSNAPRRTSLRRLLQVAFTRWNVEHAIRLCKSELGFRHFEGRNYMALMRHLVLCLVTLTFVAGQARPLGGEKSGGGGRAGLARGGSGFDAPGWLESGGRGGPTAAPLGRAFPAGGGGLSPLGGRAPRGRRACPRDAAVGLGPGGVVREAPRPGPPATRGGPRARPRAGRAAPAAVFPPP